MVSQIKAELKKLLSVRSTWIISAAIIILTSFFTFMGTSKVYEEAEQPVPQTTEQSPAVNDKTQAPVQPQLTNNLPKEKLLTNMQDSIYPITLLITVVVVLLLAHEFRYNTITYTLTLSNSRTRVLGAKVIVSIIYALIMSGIAIAATVLATYTAVNIKDLNLPPQSIDWVHIGSRLLGYCLGFSLMGLAAITLLRNQVAGIVSIFLLPTVDAILAGILSSQNILPAKWLPYSALTQFSNIVNMDFGSRTPISVTHAGLVFASYLAGAWVLAWYLFLKRDAS